MHAAIVFLPLLGSAIAGLFGRQIGDKAAQYLTTILVGLSAVLSVFVFLDVVEAGHTLVVPLTDWIVSGDFNVSWSLRFDTLTAVMLIVVNWVSFMVHLYSIGYMHHDPSVPRFQSYLSLFTFAMLMLVTADNLVQLFFLSHFGRTFREHYGMSPREWRQSRLSN